MADKCGANYKNLNRIQSFSEQSYATTQLMKQACMNDEWLRQQVEELRYLSPPAVRKVYNPLIIDDMHSYGYQENTDNTVSFSSKTNEQIVIDFHNTTINGKQIDDDYIDYSKSTCDFVNYVDGEVEPASTATLSDEPTTDTDGNAIKRLCRLHHTDVLNGDYEYDYSTATSTGGGCNSYWYVGFNKSKTYYVRPDWLKDWRDLEIPSVCRAQTFKVAKSGVLESVALKLEYNGTHSSDCGSPLYVQIWSTTKKFTIKTTWDNKTHSAKKNYITDPKNGKYDKYQHYKKDGNKYKKDKKGTYVLQREYIYWPDTKASGIWKPLASAEYNPKKMEAGGFPSIVFDNPPKLTKNHHYAIVVFSPLSEWKHCPRWGGWGRNCARDQKYPGGDAFFSENNGRSWERYGHNDDTVKEYKKGKYTPQDFAFQCNIRTKDETTSPVFTDTTEYLYLKPIFTNPVKRISITGQDEGDTSSNSKIHIQYQFSTTGADDDWFDVDDSYVTLNKPSKVILVRAKLWRSTDIQQDGTDNNKGETPIIEKMFINLEMDTPDEMYVRTKMYMPPVGHVLSARVWGRLYAPAILEPTTDCTIDIIKSEEPTDHYYIIDVDEVDEYLEKFELTAYHDEIVDLDLDARSVYLASHTEILTALKQHKVYVKPYTHSTTEAYYKLSFAPVLEEGVTETASMLGGIQIYNNVAKPILECQLQPDGSEGTTNYGEYYDYNFDYTNNILTFRKDIIDEMPTGGLSVSYNPVFIEGLTQGDVSTHTDPETGLVQEGLILDYFKESIIVDDTQAETRRVKLKAKPVDPIRSVVLNKDTDNEKKLWENKDYYLDLDTNELVFEVKNTDGISSILNSNDNLEIVYTPQLDCDGLSVAYNVSRTDKNRQAYLEGNYIEYKA